MKTLSIDIETYSDEPLQKTGVYRYVESPNFEILLFARDFAFKKKSPILPIIYETKRGMLEPGGIDHSESSRNNQSELIRNSQCTCLAN